MNDRRNNNDNTAWILVVVLALIYVSVAIVDKRYESIVLYIALVGGMAALAIELFRNRK